MPTAAEHIFAFLQRIFGSRNERLLKSMNATVARVREIEQGYADLQDADFPQKTAEFKERVAGGESLDALLPEAFALVSAACRRLQGRRWNRGMVDLPKEAADRLFSGEDPESVIAAFSLPRDKLDIITWDMVPFDVQVKGGIILHRGQLAELATGEGKTLVATMPAYLNALTGKNIQIVTVNDYLARRDRNWMAPVYEFLGLTVGTIQSEMTSRERIPQYRCDITYGTNSEFGFDYLRDNMHVSADEQCQRDRFYAILDEVDNILIDEARTPLIISGPAIESPARYYQSNRAAKILAGMNRIDFDREHQEAVRRGENKEAARERLERNCDYIFSEKEHSVILTDHGIARAQELVGVEDFYTGQNTHWEHVILQALRAKELYRRDRDYVVQDGEVIIVDEFTGRLMHGRTWSEGLHQAVEAKENLKIKQETQTLATITYQNFFRLYTKLAGMTGTAMTEATEFDQIYKLDVVAVATNRRLRRVEYPDFIYRTAKEKWKAIVDEIIRIHEAGRPILVGTISIENSEKLSEMLKRRGIKHEVLNAKQHAREAMIVARAGLAGTVTIATNMAGRGTDIKLGPGVVEQACLTPPMGEHEAADCPHEPGCGLHIIGTERHEARRIDNQLRGRSGRQGDPGASRFFLSLEDDLMRIFAGEWVSNFLKRLGMGDGIPIESRMVSRRIAGAQKKVEERNFHVRKNLLDYDGVMDEQRKIIYTQRQEILVKKGLKEMVLEMMGETLEDAVKEAFERRDESTDDWDAKGLAAWMRAELNIEVEPESFHKERVGDVLDILRLRLEAAYDEKEQRIGVEQMRSLEQFLLLQSLDTHWKDHLYALDQLKGAIGLRSYAQVDPKVEYKREAYEMFAGMLTEVKAEVTGLVFKVEMAADQQVEQLGSLWNITSTEHAAADGYREARAAYEQAIAQDQGKDEKVTDPIRRMAPKVGRNDLCPCGSGKKYKKCCGVNQ